MNRTINFVSLTIASCMTAIAAPSFAQLPTSPAPANQAPPSQAPAISTPANQAPVVPAISTPVARSGFSCDTTGENPTTIYQSSQGAPEPWIQWVSDHFSGSGWNPDARCKEVSSRLETYRKNKLLKYVTLGTVNNQSVICVATQDQGPCEGIIYTLKPGQDGIKAINNLFAWRKGEQGLQSNYESVTAIPYIEVGTRLEEAQTEVKVEIEPEQPAANPSVKPTTGKQAPIETKVEDNHREL
ncbi:MAG: COP23 domain-containing protein [Cyanobacteria bacterium J06623_7]